MGITIKAGQAYISATPSSQDPQVLRVRASSDYTSYTINANSSGSTKYDWVYLKVDATKANSPASDASDVTSIYTSRSSSNTTDNGTPPTYGLLLAVVAVANGASSITNSNITDRRVAAIIGATTGGWLSGWVAVTDQWTYSSYDSTNKTGVITVPSDATTRYSVGMRVKFSNNGATQYGIITAVASTSLTVYFGTDYSLTNSSITSNYYSSQKIPLGFPMDPIKWTISVTNPSSVGGFSTSYTVVGSNQITSPIGSWNLGISGDVGFSAPNASYYGNCIFALSTSTSSASDADLSLTVNYGGAMTHTDNRPFAIAPKNIVTTVPTTYSLIAIENHIGGVIGATLSSIIIRLVCAYL